MIIWENVSSARRDPGRIQARSRLAGEMFSHVNASEILCGIAICGGSRLNDFPGETGNAGETFSI